MPRYFFHLHDGTDQPDHLGTEMADIYEAQATAIKYSGEILREMGGRFWNATEWRLEVADENQRVLFVLRFSAEEKTPDDVEPTLRV